MSTWLRRNEERVVSPSHSFSQPSLSLSLLSWCRLFINHNHLFTVGVTSSCHRRLIRIDPRSMETFLCLHHRFTLRHCCCSAEERLRQSYLGVVLIALLMGDYNVLFSCCGAYGSRSSPLPYFDCKHRWQAAICRTFCIVLCQSIKLSHNIYQP